MAMDALDNAPGPSPWYFGPDHPHIPGFEWKKAGDTAETAGAILLAKGRTNLLVLDFYNYVQLLDPGLIVIWHQKRDHPTPPVTLRIFVLDALRPLRGNVAKLCDEMHRQEASFLAAASPLSELQIPTAVSVDPQQLEFPRALRGIDEMLMLCRTSGTESAPTPGESNLGLLIAQPKRGSYQIYPQDWFNTGKFDYDYEWATRVARDPKTGRVRGDGIRLGAFTLDASLRKTA